MAQHDYVIANGTGAAVRSDLNNALAAIVTQNSGATEPATMYAYQWWADTTTGLLKLRNGANNAWITLRELDGTLTIEDGTASSPGLAFADDLNTGVFSPGADQVAFTAGGTARLTATTTGITSALPVDVPLGSASAPTVTFTGDLNTGIYSPGADQVAISTGGTGRVFVDASGNVKVGSTDNSNSGSQYITVGSPGATVGGLQLWSTTTGSSFVQFGDGTASADNYRGYMAYLHADDALTFGTASTERLRITSAGLVGIGTTSPSSELEVRNGVITAGKVGDVLIGRYSDSFPSSGAGYFKISTNNSSGVSGGMTVSTLVGGSLGEAFRVDDNRRLLVGTSSTSNSLVTCLLQGNAAGSTSYAGLTLARGVATPADGDYLGEIDFSDNTHTASAIIRAQRDGGTWSGSSKPTRLTFSTTADGASSPTERMRIQSSGNVGILCGSGSDPLYLNTPEAAGTSRYLIFGVYGASTTTAANGTNCFSVYTNGNVQNTNGSYTTLSDAKLKENIVDASSQWDDLKAIQIRNWNFKEETGHETHRQIGPIAQELETVCPGLVFETPDRDADGNETGEVTKGVNQSVLYMKAVKALQEAMERIEQLETEMAAVKAQLA